MKIRTLLLASLLMPTMAFADAGYMEKKAPTAARQAPMMSGFYVKGEGGLSMPRFKDSGLKIGKAKKSLALGLGGGYIVNEFFRTDLMLGYRNLHAKGDTKVKAYSAVLNGYLDAHNDTIFTPYLMGGFGINKAKAKIGFKAPAAADIAVGSILSETGKSKTNFMWNLGVGVRSKVLDQMDVDVSYRYVSFGKAKVAGTKASAAGVTTDPTAFSQNVKTAANEFMAALIYRI